MNTLKLLAENISRIPEDLYFDLIISLKNDLKKGVKFANYEKQEIVSDMSKIVGENLFLKDNEWIQDLFNGSPKHDNLYYIITNSYGRKIPKWFAEKYPDAEDKYEIDN